jgi:hypothetical protein
VYGGLRSDRAISGPYEIDFRIMVEQTVRWVSARRQGADVGMVGRVMCGIFIESDASISRGALNAYPLADKIKTLS